MGAQLQLSIACLALLVVLFIFATPVADLENTALRAKHLADTVLMGLVFLATMLLGYLRLAHLLDRHSWPADHDRFSPPSYASALLCVFRC